VIQFERVPPSAEEFFRLFESCIRTVFKWDNEKPPRPLVHVFTADGDMRVRIVSDETEAMALIGQALANPAVAGASFMHEAPGVMEGTYYTRESPPRVIRIPIIGTGKDRSLGETTRDATLS